jgi:8-oxo-dGTP pyrophosphatase MutT (NUDIX family)
MELLDILDINGNKTGKITECKKPMVLEQGEYYRIVDVWIKNKENAFLISKRVPTAQPEPNRWQPTTGCAVVGDRSITAAIREVKEELGILLEKKM